MRNYRNLIAWRKSIDLAGHVYSVTSTFPQSEQFGLTQQMRRAAVSVSSNLAEGAGRNGDAEYRRFVGIAAGSASELECQILLAQTLGFIGEEESEEVMNLAAEVKKMLRSLANTLAAHR